jgi:hypothetical protein
MLLARAKNSAFAVQIRLPAAWATGDENSQVPKEKARIRVFSCTPSGQA